MIIAITSKGKTLDAEVDPRFGRAQYLILFDTEKGTFSIIDNEKNLDTARGAGIQAGQSVINAGASVLITGNCGPKAFRTLTAASVGIYLFADGTVKHAVQAFEAGSLSPVDSPNVEGHWS